MNSSNLEFEKFASQCLLVTCYLLLLLLFVVREVILEYWVLLWAVAEVQSQNWPKSLPWYLGKVQNYHILMNVSTEE